MAILNKTKVSRRAFLKGAGVMATASAVSAGCDSLSPSQVQPHTVPARVPFAQQYPQVPPSPSRVPEHTNTLKFFMPHEAQLVEAITARILPGTPEDPGAREAGVLYYIDGLLAYRSGFAEGVYRTPPYAETYPEGGAPPTDRQGEFDVVWVAETEIERYGYQSLLTPAEVMRLGLAAVDRLSQESFGSRFAEMSEDQQDQIVAMMADGEATGFEPLSGETFFQVLRRLTSEGMFSDPVYGGNRDLVGWKLLGYPGAQRAYTPDDIVTEGSGLTRPVWGLADLPHFYPGQAGHENTLLPVTGSEEGQP